MSDAHDYDEHSETSGMDLRVRALRSVLEQKGYLDPVALDVLIDTYETQIGPRNGAHVVARAWGFGAERVDRCLGAVSAGPDMSMYRR